VAVHQQHSGAVPARADPEGNLANINEIEPEAIEHAAILPVRPDRRSHLPGTDYGAFPDGRGQVLWLLMQ